MMLQDTPPTDRLPCLVQLPVSWSCQKTIIVDNNSCLWFSALREILSFMIILENHAFTLRRYRINGVKWLDI